MPDFKIRFSLCLMAALLLGGCQRSQALEPRALQEYVEGIAKPAASIEQATTALQAEGFDCAKDDPAHGPFCRRKVHASLVCDQIQFVQLPLKADADTPVRTGISSVCL